MEVYIVTSGSYSDYGIDRVFLNKEKAEKYVKTAKDGYHDDKRIETYETSDDKAFEVIKYVDVDYEVEDGEVTYNFKVQTTNTLESTEASINYTYYYERTWGSFNSRELTINRVVSGELNEEQLKAKFKKVCEDTMAHIKSLREIEEWSDEMVEEWLDSGVNEYISAY